MICNICKKELDDGYTTADDLDWCNECYDDSDGLR